MSHRAVGRTVTADPDAVDDRECTVLHVDMDAFFAAVELRRRPELRGRPMMVAGTGTRGVVLSATYEARRYGIRSAMPTATALARCPAIAVVPPDQAAYGRASAAVMAVFAAVTPRLEQVSIDEAFLDVSGAGRIAGRPGRIAQALRARIAEQLELTATIGAASSKFVAKLASGLAKPDGLLIVPPGDVLALLRPLPVGALWGVGPQTAEKLMRLGLTTVGELADVDPALLVRTLGGAVGRKLHELAWGRDDRAVQPPAAESSVGAETTFDVDCADAERLRRELLALAQSTARRARSAAAAGRTVSIKVRFADFTTVTRSETLSTPTDLARAIYAAALRQLERLGQPGRRVRLIGVRLEGLVPLGSVSEQLELGAAVGRPGWRAAEDAADRIAARFPAAAVRPAVLFSAPEAPGQGR